MQIIVINPGSTSTKIAVFKNSTNYFHKKIVHEAKDLKQFKTIIEQYKYRRDLILLELEKNSFRISTFDAVVGRGGLLKPIASGVYKVNQAMINDLQIGYSGQHPSNLGGLLAREIAQKIKYSDNAFIVDPVVVDEMEDIARISGIPEIPRRSILHTLNQRSMAHKYARENHTSYENLNLIVVHMGGGISIGAHQKGRIVDTGSGNIGEGTFTPERSGGVPIWQFAELCFSKKYSHDEIKKMIIGQGGIFAYLGTNNIKEILNHIERGDNKAELILNAMIYQIAKEIGAFATVLKGDVDAIILTGEIAHNKLICDAITTRVQFICHVIVYPGSNEEQALAEGVLNALNGKAPIKEYE